MSVATQNYHSISFNRDRSFVKRGYEEILVHHYPLSRYPMTVFDTLDTYRGKV
jgi:hypothetical protein